MAYIAYACLPTNAYLRMLTYVHLVSGGKRGIYTAQVCLVTADR